MAGGLRYAGFITHADADERAAVWLCRNLEAYRVPDALVGWEGPTGTIGKRIGAFFRKTESAPEGELAADVRAALDASHALIVVRPLFDAQGGPETAEIRYFKSLGRGNRIMTAIVGDELGAASESFVWRKLADGAGHDAQETDAPAAANSDGDGPIVADFRGGARERDAARFKIVSGLLGVGLDELVARERAVRRGRAARFAAAAGIVIGVAGGGLTAITMTNPPREAPRLHAQQASEPVRTAQSAELPRAAPVKTAQAAPAAPRPTAPAAAPPRPAQVAIAAPRPAAPAASPARPAQVATAAPRPAAPVAAPPRPAKVATAPPRPIAPAAAPPRPTQVAKAAPRPTAPAAAPPRPTQVAAAAPRPTAPAVAPPRPTQVAKAAPRPTARAAAPPRPTQVATAAPRPTAPAVAPPRPTQIAKAAPRPTAPAAAPPRPSQVATAAPRPTAPAAAPPRPTQVATAAPPPTPVPPPRAAATPAPATQATIVQVSAPSGAGPQPTLLQQLRDLGGAQSAAVRCRGSANQSSRDRARSLIASSPQPHQAALIGAYNEGYRAAEGRADACPVEPVTG